MSAAEETAVVSKVIDGDTCQLEDGRRIRYLGIEAPEEQDRYGEPATQANHLLVTGKSIRIEFGKPREDRDGRLLAYVFIEKVFVNAELVRQGHAHVRRPVDVAYRSALMQAQDEARLAGRGIWDSIGARQLRIAWVQAKVEGPAKRNLNDEYITIENQGNQPVDLTGWKILDEAGNPYLVPKFTLEPKRKFTLRTGSGKNTEQELFWGSRTPIWNDNGDTIFIRDAEGKLVLSHIY
ncbi:MAG: thermonuclease family protein [Verrucomicrobia bacterium]|nr:thermonuclease family protein [Verrucomicrobiota bacterium]